MAKRKSQKDPEELPDAPSSTGKGKRKNVDHDSDSDSVTRPIPPLECALM
jgi:protein BCP1